MRIFITGASGYIGHAVGEAFRQAGYRVYGLVRTEEKAKQLLASEIVPVIGDLSQPQTYAQAMHDAEVIIHCAFEKSPKGLELENKTIDAILKTPASENQTRTFIYTSGIWVLGNSGGCLADEFSPLNALDLVKWRVFAEERIFNAASKNLRTIVLRPGVVFGGRGGLTTFWFQSIAQGAVEIVGEGHNHWAMVHYRDLAAAYVLAAEKELNRVAINLVDNSYDTVKEMALAVARMGGIPGKIKPLSFSEASQKFGSLAEGLMVDQHISNERARRLLSWVPRHHSFLTDIDLYLKSHFNCCSIGSRQT